MARPRRRSIGSVMTGFIAGAAVSFLTTVTVVPPSLPSGATVSQPGDGSVVGTQGPGVSPTSGSGPTVVETLDGRSSGIGRVEDVGGLQCARGQNGGATDTGVSATEIKLGSTVAEEGIGAAFLGEARHAMEAVRNDVNRSGGICGRSLRVLYKDDGWDPQQGFTFIKNLVEAEKVFALSVVPSSEGLDKASAAGYFERTGVPVVGSDGMIRTQYTDDHIFPVAAATVSLTHIMAQDAWNRGARKFGIVFEKTYRFGVEGAYAFNQAYRRLTEQVTGHGQDIPGYRNPLKEEVLCDSGTQFCSIEANQGTYSGQIANFNAGCFPQDRAKWCDFVALLLEPQTALQWMLDENANPADAPAKGTAAVQPLFTYNFGFQCSDKCNRLRLWTGYNPPIEQYESQPAVSRYVTQLRNQNAQADRYNQFTEGAYLGMTLVVEALKKVGPRLTRATLMDVLHSMTLDTGLSTPLSWRPGNHFSNSSAQAFEIRSTNGFSGWRFLQGYIKDPWLGQDIG